MVCRKEDGTWGFITAKLEKLESLPKVNIVATRSQDDVKEMYDLLGDAKHRKMLDTQFKNNDSNFQIVIVVDMWITGFDVPSLAVMYIDKPFRSTLSFRRFPVSTVSLKEKTMV